MLKNDGNSEMVVNKTHTLRTISSKKDFKLKFFILGNFFGDVFRMN